MLSDLVGGFGGRHVELIIDGRSGGDDVRSFSEEIGHLSMVRGDWWRWLVAFCGSVELRDERWLRREKARQAK